MGGLLEQSNTTFLAPSVAGLYVSVWVGHMLDRVFR